MELTKATDRNPAALLHANYQGLMTLGCVDQLKAEATEIVEASEISEKNLAKWKRTVENISGLDQMRMYITNFLLAADGQRVINRRGSEHDETRRMFK